LERLAAPAGEGEIMVRKAAKNPQIAFVFFLSDSFNQTRQKFVFITCRGRAEWHEALWAGCANGTTETLQALFDVVAQWLERGPMEEKLLLKALNPTQHLL
jgi:hypothetical protein